MNYIDITSPDINNGLGCRVTLWLAGCPFHCKGCHNPESWDWNFGKKFDYYEIYHTKLKDILDKEYIAGITISGGEGIVRKNEDILQLTELCKLIKKNHPTKNIWVYTGGFFDTIVQQREYKEYLKYIDVIIDGQFILEERNITLPFRGSNNQRIIDVQKSLKKHKTIEYIIKD